VHCPAAMHFDRCFRDADVVSNLFAEAAAHHLYHDLALPRAQRSEAVFQARQRLLTLPAYPVARKAELDGVKQILVAERLCEELDGAPLHRLNRHGNIAMSRDEDNRKVSFGSGEFLLEVEAALTGQPDIEHQAHRSGGWFGLQKVSNGCKQLTINTERSQQAA